MSEKEIENKNKPNYLAIALVLSLVAMGAVLYLNYSEKTRLEGDLTLSEAELETAYFQLDSIGDELSDRILTISQLGGRVDSLVMVKEQLENEKEQIRNRTNKEIGDLRSRVDGYRELLLAKDEEIIKLQAINEVLATENTELKVQTNQLNKSLRNLNETKTQLEEKVAVAGQLSIESMKIIAVSSRGKERVDDIKNRHIDKLRIEFAVSENPVAEIESKDILVRIVAPDGNVLFDITRGSGSFIFQDREMFFTAKQEILYDRSRQALGFLYDKGSEYALGLHKVEVYTEDYLMGSGTFIVK
ncbi:MAG: chromosome segregation protein SMC [Bacteroidetes bacterium]|nr:chromosome segregation protein SMC [Bacteroidota bacterium]MDA1122145.1 chromosome segregation protein SMC [Bacteroidota bacterium]